ncbi:Phosphatidylinositol 5-phosphate 4-kinase type-2 alpha [Podila epicladia]|nr:Phosphatidylinositol 5-phosphate 4-kinase type-2 alpha [Podila epicladia]KAG0087903.1 Phosphatidylinositol 5-phosphate 4-kinase type-2 alpha [Podila epicladia]
MNTALRHTNSERERDTNKLYTIYPSYHRARKAPVEHQGIKLKNDHYMTPEKRKPRKSKAKSLTAHKVDSEADPATLSKLTANLYKPKKGILAHSGLSAKRGTTIGQATIRTRIQESHRDQDAVLVDTEARWKDHHLKRQWAQSVLLESMEPVLSKHLRHAIKSVLHFTSVGPETMDIKSTSQGIGGWESFVAPMVAPLPKVSGKSDTVTPETNSSKAPPTVVHSILPGLSRSSSLVKPSTSQSNVAKALEPPLPIESSLNKLPTLSPSESPSVTQGPSLREHDTQLSQAPTPIIVRGFRSASVSRPAELTYPRPMSTAAGRAKELDQTITPVPSPRDSNTNRQTVTTTSKTPQVPDKDTTTNSTSLPTIPDNAAIEQQHQQQKQQPSRTQSKPSRLWSKVRKAVNGGFAPSTTSFSSIYQSAGGIASNLRSMSDTHLPYRPVSSTSTSSFNPAMPSFSSSVLSLLSDDQMSATERTPMTAPRHPSFAFETPPETAPSSPVSSSKHGRQHFLPDLARRSSTKSPVAKAELTTAESNVSHFVAARREEGRRFTDSRPESMVEELGIRLEQGLVPKSSSRSSRLSMGSSHSHSNSNRRDESRLSNEEIPLSNRNSSLSFDQGTSGNINQDFDQFLTTHQGYIEQDEAPTISLQDEPKSPSPRHSADIQRERMAALSKIEGRTESARNSLINSSEEDQRASRMLLAPSTDLLNPTKEDRRKSAISFGTYFSGPSPAALRRARDQLDRSISGMETGSKGEIFHMRRTSFFDRPSSPRVESSISPSFPPSSLKTVGPPNYPSHSASTGAQLHSQQNDSRVSTSASNLPNGTDSRKKRVPLKISPLVITGVSSLPSPMVAPMSAIPRQITLDRYFFTADQVHEWNIPSYGRVKFTDHAPLVFQAVRERFQYTLQDLDEALSQPMTVMRTPGKSDAVFFVSHNHGRFLLKTLRGSEPENLRNFLSDYMAHIHKHPNTLLPRYLGMYTFEKLSGSKMTGPGPAGHHHGDSHHYRDADRDPGSPFKAGPGRKHDLAASHHHLHLNGTLLSGKDDGLPSKVVVVVLANVFDTANLVHERYDFKGSNVGRKTLSEQPPTTTVVPPTPTTDHSIGLDIPGADLFRRHSQRNQRRQEANFNRAQNAQHDTPGSTIPSETTKEAISNLTLKEMDFQNRVNDGQTHLIHVGMTKRAEILSQLEEDTSLLRKHGFMDYSMLVGIHLVPKATMASDVSESSAGGSQGSMASDADYSNLDDDDDDNGATSGEETKATTDSVPDTNPQAVDRLLALMNDKGLLSHEQTAYLKKLKTATEETILEVVEMVRGGGEVEVGEGDTKDPTRGGSNRIEKTPRIQHSKDPSDWGAFRTPAGTIRQNPKSDARRVRPKAVGGSKGTRTHSHRRHQSRLLHRGSISQDRSTPLKQRPRDAKRPVSPLQHKFSLPMLFSTDNNNSWSQGVPSVGLPDGYEAVYYFGLIDILQKYNMFKWFERNIKGANARLLGPSTPSSSLAPPNGLSPQHPGRSTPSTSFSASSLYQLLPMASASEPSLPLAESSFPPSSTLSVLMENPASRPTSTVSLMDHHHHRYPLPADKRSSTGTSNISSASSSSHHLSHSSTQGSSSSLSASKSATGLSSRLSQVSHHSRQPSHHSGKSVSMSQAHDNHHHHKGESVLESSPPLPVGPLSSSPQALSLQEQVQTQTQMPRHQSQPSYQAFNQHAEVSVEEPGRYAERLVDFMRGVLV